MVELRATGSFYRTGSDGLLVGRAGRERLTQEWAEPVAFATARIAAKLGDSVDGIYLCGPGACGGGGAAPTPPRARRLGYAI